MHTPVLASAIGSRAVGVLLNHPGYDVLIPAAVIVLARRPSISSEHMLDGKIEVVYCGSGDGKRWESGVHIYSGSGCVLSNGNVEGGWWTYVIYDCKHLHRRLTMQLVSISTAAVAFTSTATCTSAFGLNAAAITKSLGAVLLIGCLASRAKRCSTRNDCNAACVSPLRMVAAPICVSAPAARAETIAKRRRPEFVCVAPFADFWFVSHS